MILNGYLVISMTENSKLILVSVHYRYRQYCNRYQTDTVWPSVNNSQQTAFACITKHWWLTDISLVSVAVSAIPIPDQYHWYRPDTDTEYWYQSNPIVFRNRSFIVILSDDGYHGCWCYCSQTCCFYYLFG